MKVETQASESRSPTDIYTSHLYARWHGTSHNKAGTGITEVRISRRRLVPERASAWEGFTAFVNTPVQGGAGDGMNHVLVLIHKRLSMPPGRARWQTRPRCSPAEVAVCGGDYIIRFKKAGWKVAGTEGEQKIEGVRVKLGLTVRELLAKFGRSDATAMFKGATAWFGSVPGIGYDMASARVHPMLGSPNPIPILWYMWRECRVCGQEWVVVKNRNSPGARARDFGGSGLA